MDPLRTPLFDWHVARKARMVPFGGWEMPVQYSGIIHEHQIVRNAAGMFDISHMARFDLNGPDALTLIQKVFTNDAAKMKAGQVKYGLVCKENGGILDDILVYRFADHWAMVVNASNREKIFAWLAAQKGSLDTTVTDHTLESAMIAVQGPTMLTVCHEMFPDDPSALKYYHAMETTYRGWPCVVSRTGYTGEDGLEISIEKTQAVALADDLLDRGAVPCGLGARDTLRLEAAMPLYGHELNETITPIQAGLGWAVKFDKGEFIGREALEESEGLMGVQMRRVGLELEGKRAAREHSTILAGGIPMGVVTSGSYVPTLEKSIAMGYVAPRAAFPGSELMVDIRGTPTPAKVVPMPFYKRAK
ncbi:glycine cleavage system aminomethyltransferase GcvT [Zavarzinella formosa]|uniref:glycine cleavage system aminomethyltransferase GcvT n=1 Tax=Zavarzinella formosa TaxID=360055 RepID=UPI0002F3D4E0|nr:glycine cleavage system aminomethyltransferase GcvT [Zavarzinella formosa]